MYEKMPDLIEGNLLAELSSLLKIDAELLKIRDVPRE